MNIDFQHEQAITLAEVVNHLPKRNGKKVHYSTVYRWTTKGARGRVLESRLVGGIRYSTVEALQRFMNPEDSPQQETTLAIDQALTRAGM